MPRNGRAAYLQRPPRKVVGRTDRTHTAINVL
jgi:hypothetical protein